MHIGLAYLQIKKSHIPNKHCNLEEFTEDDFDRKTIEKELYNVYTVLINRRPQTQTHSRTHKQWQM